MRLACLLLALADGLLQPAASAFSSSSSSSSSASLAASGSLRSSRGVNVSATHEPEALLLSGKKTAALAAVAGLDEEMVPPALAAHAACLADEGKYEPDGHGSDDGKKRTGKCYRNPKVWGPPTWFFLHAMTLALPDQVPQEKRLAIENLMNALPFLLPCPPCGKNLGEKLKEMPIKDHLSTRDDMVQYMIDLHNRVNRATGKPELTKEEVLEEYDAAFKRDGDVKYMAVLAPEPEQEKEKPEQEKEKPAPRQSRMDPMESIRQSAAAPAAARSLLLSVLPAALLAALVSESVVV